MKAMRLCWTSSVNEKQSWRPVRGQSIRRHLRLIFAVCLCSNKATPQPPATPAPAPRTAKKKVVETEPEPSHTEAGAEEGAAGASARTLEMLVSATADYCKVKCTTEKISFRDTLMFQTRVYE